MHDRVCEGQDMRLCGVILCAAAALLAAACDGGKKGGAQTPATLMAAPTGDPVNPGMPTPNVPK
jgi:hypothetical protein